jgi:hypothetical protein
VNQVSVLTAIVALAATALTAAPVVQSAPRQAEVAQVCTCCEKCLAAKEAQRHPPAAVAWTMDYKLPRLWMADHLAQSVCETSLASALNISFLPNLQGEIAFVYTIPFVPFEFETIEGFSERDREEFHRAIELAQREIRGVMARELMPAIAPSPEFEGTAEGAASSEPKDRAIKTIENVMTGF